jgi:acyl carrier protein
MENTIKNRIYTIMAFVFHQEISNLNEYSSQSNISNWDSLRHLSLIVSIEDEFSISIADDEVNQLKDFKSIYEYVCKSLSN